jgi:hypothetical protein
MRINAFKFAPLLVIVALLAFGLTMPPLLASLSIKTFELLDFAETITGEPEGTFLGDCAKTEETTAIELKNM